MPLHIRPLVFEDFPLWLPLWIENNQGHYDEDVTRQTWGRITNESENVFGYGAFKGEEMVGILHYILHPTTGCMSDACYMQDLFTTPDHRGEGVAKKLLNALAQKYRAEKWARIYWVAENDNIPAQKLYKNFGTKIDFSVHIMIDQPTP